VTVFVSIFDEVIYLQARAEGSDAVGDLTLEVRPGQSALGKTYDEWTELGPGAHEID
jgi:hypothetical protein